ncbi:MAG: FxSxx-COOH system tetratricopeptide repeat protein, partial [Defluviitaleaceae bacterium]|nr:FxSxx-COOH system tetratricopeptide repeat protein [Defluviitaleaceae bacterium]
MSFFEFIGTTADIIGIANPVMTKLKSEKADYKNFLASIKNIVKAGCAVYRETLSASEDHRDVFFPEDYINLVQNAVVSAIESDVEFTDKMVLPNEHEFPEGERKRLFDIISIRLKHHSLDFLLRQNFIKGENAYREQLAKLQTIIDSFGLIASDITKIKEYVFPDSSDTAKKSSSESRPPGSLPPNNLPFGRNHHFTGRDNVFERICAAFESGHAMSLTQAVTGMGGLGKTQTALEYAYRCADKYDLIWWVQAETDAHVLASYKQFAVRMELMEEHQEISGQRIIDKVLEWMNNNGGWLFIYDNVEKLSNEWRPKSSNGHILITTRNKLGHHIEALDISVFSADESVAFLEKSTGIDNDKENALALAERLGHLPLALEQAVAAITYDDECDSFGEYMSKLGKRGLRALKSTDDTFKYSLPVAETLEFSINKIGNEATRQLLYLCAYIAPENIEKSLFAENAEFLPSPLREVLQDPDDESEPWAELTKFSLLKKQEGEENKSGYTMHRLLQEVVRGKVAGEQVWAECLLRLFDETYDFEYGDVASNDRFLKLSSHVESFLVNTASVLTSDGDKKTAAHLYNMGGFGFNNLGHYSRALEWYERGLNIDEKVLGKEHPDTATTYNNIAEVYSSQRDYDKALELHQKTLAIYEKVLGAEHPDTTAAYNNIATVYYYQGDCEKALELHQKALAIFEKVLGAEHPDTAATYNNIAAVYRYQGDYDKALEFYQKALVIQEKALGSEQPSTATTYNNIALVYGRQGDYDKALEFYQKALIVTEKVL